MQFQARRNPEIVHVCGNTPSRSGSAPVRFALRAEGRCERVVLAAGQPVILIAQGSNRELQANADGLKPTWTAPARPD